MPVLETLGAYLASTGVSAFNDARQNRERRQLSDYEFNQNMRMWQMNNQYNHPAQQMARLKEAGLNPNLVYGSGTVGNTSAAPPRYDAPDYEASFNAPNILETLGQSQNIEIQKQQKANLLAQQRFIESQTLKNKAQTTNELVRSKILRSDSIIRKISASFAQELQETQLSANQQQLTNAQKQEAILNLERQIKEIELQLRQKGVSPNDPAYIRLMGQWWDAIMSYGLDEDDLPRRLLDKFLEHNRNNPYKPEPTYRIGTIRQ